jgi:endonuclease YncB( thermonuclease family)
MDHPFGKPAKWALVNLCKGQEVRAVFDGDLSHERCVATCYLPDGRDLSAEMVKAGLAIDWPRFSKGKYRHLEPEGARKKLWRCDARQKGRMPSSIPD